ncbi:MAG TPA: tetratricopeptide repeat protein [Candidatus Limnocylindrales bacterium]|nr:tetratricopeptide repeat protein [Candidatus Limnocylindrales bacterium]
MVDSRSPSPAERLDLARDRPDAYIPRDRRWALATGRTLPDRVHGSALFADISGFTPLTEALAKELGPQRGAEELSASIGRVFHAVIGELDAYDGNVIYFAGDAITCWIDGDDGTRACAAATAMQEAMLRTGRIVTPGGSEVQLAMKVAIAVGPARRFVVGDPEIQLIDVLAGRLMDELAEAEHHAGRGEIVLAPSAMTALGERVALGARRTDAATGRTCAVLLGQPVEVDLEPGHQPPPLPEALVRPWLLPVVYERLRTGRGEFLAELRPAVPVFLRFSGIDYDNDDEAADKLDEFVRAAQRVLDAYEGNVLQLTLGDKGAYLYGVFGSPFAHEDDAARAAAATLELRDLDRTTAAREIQVGATQGRLRSGTYGHEMRRTFVCLGDAVNLAARLMSAAPPGRIYVSGPIHDAAGDAFIWERVPDLTVKGKAAPVETWSLTGSLERASRRRTRFEIGLVGRRREVAALEASHAESLMGHARVVGIAAEAGLGKSRLVAEFVRNVRRGGHTVAFGECQAYGTRTPYFVWREIWRRLLDLDDHDPAAAQVAAVKRRLAAVDPGLVARAPLLSDVVGLSIPETDLTRGFDAKLRKTSLEDLLAVLLRARAHEAPFVAVLEDCHWIDELSRDLLNVLIRAATALPVQFVLAYRPAPEPGGGLGVEGHAGFSELALDRMEPDDVEALVSAKMEQLSGGAGDDDTAAGAGVEVNVALVALVAARSEGNPFYVEELLNFIVAQGIDTSDPAAVEAVRLPESLHTLVLSRIDAASEGPRRTLKVASVIGRVFAAPMLPGAYEELGDVETVTGNLRDLRTLDLVALDREADQAWMFKHVVTQEVAYESLPFALRAILHGRVGEHIERAEAADIERVVPLLEHHFWRSDREAKKREYLRRAAEAAQASFANHAAIAYFDRLIGLIEGAERIDARLRLGRVLDLVGDWSRAVTVNEDALAAAAAAGDAGSQGWAHAALADIARKQGQFEEATSQLAAASARFAEAGDEAGLGQVLHLAGTVAAQTGDLGLARTRYEESLAIRTRLGDTAKMGSLYSNLAIVAEYGDDMPETRRMAERALELRIEAGDTWGIGVSHNNLGAIAIREGRLEEARDHIEEALRLLGQVGDTWFAASAQALLANVSRDLGDHAAASHDYAACLPVFVTLDDQLAQAEVLEDIATLAARMGRHAEAVELAAAAATLREALGSPLADSLADELRAGLEESVAVLGEAAAAATARGRALGRAAAVERAMAVCEAAEPG